MRVKRRGIDVKQSIKWTFCALLWAGILASASQADASRIESKPVLDEAKNLGSIHGESLSVSINTDGSYSIASTDKHRLVLRSSVEAVVDGAVLQSSAYPEHKIVQSEFHDEFGSGSKLTVTHAGLAGKPDLVCTIRLYRDRPWGDIAVEVSNSTSNTVAVQAIRSVQITGTSEINLNGPESNDRVLSDSFSEDRPQLAIHDLGEAPKGMLRAVGTQLIYNRKSGESLFFGALTSDRLLTILHLKEQGTGADAKIVSYEAESTGTTEIMKEESLLDSPAAEQVILKLPVEPGASLSSERLMFAVGSDYHTQLEQYGRAIKVLHKARVETPTPIGWWSWTAYYFGLNQGAAITNAEWLAENLKASGYKYFQIDEGYQYARGEYTPPDVNLFPRGIAYVADKVRANGLKFGVWTSPFQVSERAWVYQNHKDWLLHNAAGQLIHAGEVVEHKDPLYVLDTTNPGAQEYLQQTYTKLHDWGVRFIKMDFMDDSAVEGSYYRPNTTALEAQRVGLGIIRKAMGEDTVLDKDGSTMLNPVGYVDAGRISQDTGHTFEASRDAASGIAARYFMNRNFFIADPDAFTVSTQTVDDQSWHNEPRPLTFEEAKVSVALSAVSGGMFELGDDLPTLGATPERLALVKNPDLLDMARLGRSSIPIDLMTFEASDAQPSIFLLKESKRQSILTVFNWTEVEQKRNLRFAGLGLKEPSKYRIMEVFAEKDCCNPTADGMSVVQPAHTVRMFKLLEDAVQPAQPAIEIHSTQQATAGETVDFIAAQAPGEEPVLQCRWEFGDGSSENGLKVHHAYTLPGEYTVRMTATGLGESTASKTATVTISGNIATKFVPAEKKRPE